MTQLHLYNQLSVLPVKLLTQRQLEHLEPRDEYRELLYPTITFLGGLPSSGISFRAPAGLHRARWMAKSVYSIKILMFKGQFKLTKREEKSYQTFACSP